MRDRALSVVGGVGLFVAVLGFALAAATGDSELTPVWGTVMTLGVAAFFWSDSTEPILLKVGFRPFCSQKTGLKKIWRVP